jgi:hypothetical protein
MKIQMDWRRGNSGERKQEDDLCKNNKMEKVHACRKESTETTR